MAKQTIRQPFRMSSRSELDRIAEAIIPLLESLLYSAGEARQPPLPEPTDAECEAAILTLCRSSYWSKVICGRLSHETKEGAT